MNSEDRFGTLAVLFVASAVVALFSIISGCEVKENLTSKGYQQRVSDGHVLWQKMMPDTIAVHDTLYVDVKGKR